MVLCCSPADVDIRVPCTSCSPPGSAALERWSGEHGGNKLRFECAGQQEVETWSHLLDCIHSMGQQLPAGRRANRRSMQRSLQSLPTARACGNSQLIRHQPGLQHCSH